MQHLICPQKGAFRAGFPSDFKYTAEGKSEGSSWGGGVMTDSFDLQRPSSTDSS